MVFIRLGAFSLIYLLSSILFGTELTELEEGLKKAPHSDRPSLLIKIADTKLKDLKQISNNILWLRKTFHESLGEKDRGKKNKELREIFENIFKTFDNFRSEVSICASFDEEKSFYGYSLFAQAYYDFTELFVQFVKEDLFPRDWKSLNFDGLKKEGSAENN